MLRKTFTFSISALLALPAFAADDVVNLKKQLQELRRGMLERQQQLDRLEQRLQALEKTPPKETVAAKPAPVLLPKTTTPQVSRSSSSVLDQAVAESVNAPRMNATSSASASKSSLWSQPLGNTGQIRLIDVSLDTMLTAGCANVNDSTLSTLQGGGHDPNKCGFTLQQAELSLAGAIDPYLRGEAHLLMREDGVELEEAFASTTRLPYGLQVKGGYFLTEFGRMNPTHPHAWQWVDQSIVNTRLLGGEGLRSSGARVSWVAPTPWYSAFYFSAQNPNSSTASSFLGNSSEHGESNTSIGQRPTVDNREVRGSGLLYMARLENGWDFSPQTSAKFGVSALWGANRGGMNTSTQLYGADLVMKWRPENNFRGYPFVSWETEVMRRNYGVDAVHNGDAVVADATTLKDWGFYTQALVGFKPQWAAGLRYEKVGGSGESLGDGGRANDPLRNNRQRISPLLAYYPSEFSRIRLQYNYDDADHLEKKAQAVWLNIEFLFGKHPAHNY
jgi:hypothetical protein